MKEEQNIDKIFREKLEGFTEEPPAFIWPGIMDQMKAARLKKRRAWYSWSAVAALLLLAFIAGWYLNENSTPPVIVQTEPVRQEKVPVREENEPVAQSPSGEETGEETGASQELKIFMQILKLGKKKPCRQQKGSNLSDKRRLLPMQGPTSLFLENLNLQRL
jgi:hypothetical protein